MHFDKTYLLLMIVKECLGHPKLKGIADAAMAELQDINSGLKPKVEAAPQPEETVLTPEPDRSSPGPFPSAIERKV